MSRSSRWRAGWCGSDGDGLAGWPSPTSQRDSPGSSRVSGLAPRPLASAPDAARQVPHVAESCAGGCRPLWCGPRLRCRERLVRVTWGVLAWPPAAGQAAAARERPGDQVWSHRGQPLWGDLGGVRWVAACQRGGSRGVGACGAGGVGDTPIYSTSPRWFSGTGKMLCHERSAEARPRAPVQGSPLLGQGRGAGVDCRAFPSRCRGAEAFAGGHVGSDPGRLLRRGRGDAAGVLAPPKREGPPPKRRAGKARRVRYLAVHSLVWLSHDCSGSCHWDSSVSDLWLSACRRPSAARSSLICTFPVSG